MTKTQLKNMMVYIEKDEDGMFVGSVPALGSCHAEGKTIKEMVKNLEQVAKLCIRNRKKDELNSFVGIQSIDLSHA